MSLAIAEPPAVDFAAQVKPILAGKCWNCHGPDPATREADLRLDRRDAAAYVLEGDSAADSELVARIMATDPSVQMPPADSKKPLSTRERELLVRWIAAGAPYDRHWAFQPPERSVVPQPRSADSLRGPIDHFVAARLESAGLQLAPAAQRTTLLRRLSLDLTGLPPDLDSLEAFLDDTSPDAYEKQVDRLLSSPQYGEHMAVSWLDAARYADTDGYQNDRYRYMHVWRDWVVQALNQNLPYDRFLIEQLAGDLLPDATLSQQIATGFCRNHRINSEDGSIPQEWHVENVADRVDTLGTAVLGLTIACARCHDHKYDPVTIKEYYRLYAFFNNVPEWGVGPNNGNSPPFVSVPPNWQDLPPEQNVAQEPEPVQLRRAREQQGNGLKRPQAGGPNTVMVMHELPEPRPTYLLQRGQFDQPDTGSVLTADVPALLGLPLAPNSSPDTTSATDATSATDVPNPAPANRLDLARWLVDPRHPLTARVAVNRYWQHFFGRGLVATTENFGIQGELPSHPELLDWLAVEFVHSGWDVKAIHKRIVMSATYRQSSRVTQRDGQPDVRLRKDPENRLLSRGPRFRHHPFVLRDSALAASGLLVRDVGGVPAKPYMPPKIWSSISNNTYKQDQGGQLYRRSVYTFWRRTIPPPTMVTFNAAPREVCVVRTDQTNTPLQALALMNNRTFVEASRALAARMLHAAAAPEQAIRFGFRSTLSRDPEPEELILLVDAHRRFLNDFQKTPEGAEQLLGVGAKPRDTAFDAVPHAAMTMTASLLFNLDEAVTKE
ncbi:PSD1 and planctomycete cytochrome C domain-containing protein [Roseimaritima sediminicola]|uniref:PSD1 and planctomycete cytochrome C domain-containing protein n=1 Tax=Roseimaritima sediminicola TaxID=2662066 RepID=UPI0013874F7E|nr:PSD1 and planctomycete cytochrome C domain-containing protein [Roseimaritima sediminicola]